MSALATMFADHRDRLRRPAEPIVRSAEFEGSYRLSLTRTWGAGPTIVIAGCNPSRADADRDDPTMSREMAFANRWGFGGLVKINVYPVIAATISMGALRTWRAGYPATWSRNMDRATELLGDAGAAWAAWGALVPDEDLGAWLPGVAGRLGRRVCWQCLGVTATGSPKHTLARGRHRIPDDPRAGPAGGEGRPRAAPGMARPHRPGHDGELRDHGSGLSAGMRCSDGLRDRSNRAMLPAVDVARRRTAGAAARTPAAALSGV